METVTLSPDFHFVIPPALRETLRLVPGQKFRIVRHKDMLEFTPVQPIEEHLGMALGINTAVEGNGDQPNGLSASEERAALLRELHEARGSLHGVNPDIEREQDRL